MSNVETTEQHRQLRPVEHHAIGAGRHARHPEAAARKALVIEDEAAAIPEEHLHAIAATTDEDEEVAAERIEREHVAHERAESVVAATKVHRLRREIHLRARRQRQHDERTAPSSAATYPTSVPTATRSVMSPTQSSITGAVFTVGSPTGITETGRTRSGAVTLISPRRFHRHHDNVAGLTP